MGQSSCPPTKTEIVTGCLSEMSSGSKFSFRNLEPLSSMPNWADMFDVKSAGRKELSVLVMAWS